ncbi:hypothetical protein Bca101_049776 [Brassica carinata]
MEVSGKKAMTGLEATTAKLEATVKTEHGGGPEHGRRRSEQDNEDLCLTRRRWKKLGCTSFGRNCKVIFAIYKVYGRIENYQEARDHCAITGPKEEGPDVQNYENQRSMRSSSRRIWSITTTAKLDPTTAKARLTTTCGFRPSRRRARRGRHKRD